MTILNSATASTRCPGPPARGKHAGTAAQWLAGRPQAALAAQRAADRAPAAAGCRPGRAGRGHPSGATSPGDGRAAGASPQPASPAHRTAGASRAAAGRPRHAGQGTAEAAAVRADRCAGARVQADPRRPVAAQPDAAAGAGRRRLRQDRGCRAGGDAGASQQPARLAGTAWRAHRLAGRQGHRQGARQGDGTGRQRRGAGGGRYPRADAGRGGVPGPGPGHRR
ncbi:hypothetical protein G6F23_013319 [Rhizopus arrhizus]|nr:hypothetical protein G6F23_013319 [Rhizopus arrhizus]